MLDNARTGVVEEKMARDDLDPAALELNDSLDPQAMFAAEEFEEAEEPEASAEAEDAEVEEVDPREELKKLKQRLGTDEDVSVVKSQRDRLRNQLEEYQGRVEPLVQELSARMQQMEQSRVQQEYQQWESQWQGYVASSPDARTRQAREAEFASARQTAQQRMQMYQQEQELARREQVLRQSDAQKGQQALIDFVTSTYEDMAKEVGIDPSKLKRENYSALKQSFQEQLQQSRLKQAPRNLPTRPRHGGRTGGPKDVNSWFDSAIGSRDYQKLEDAFSAAKQFDGLRLEDIISR